ncbi:MULTISPECIES: putative quinol monooxygenase [Sphingobium]|uniref:putative quinol monooxygenase n=1 Tax=Sphingobium TaxID=165695 RepID=UPI0015ECC596|nr:MULTISPECIES: antibiotic biosynthesis monooxygenase family protein [Sphingobium]MCW2361368.1 quinol monooxygenase YgiN [Sphingobium sp. B10D3B]MCW2401953.1 quinol monooxygenase YgiN [Sphingobium sp. B10D7B]MCW2408932.1 quinol monooxygenase YgiN [Sphingobium xanthum]
MTVARIYIIPAADGKSAEMESALTALSKIVSAVEGSTGVELLRDLGNEHRFIFIEKWVSEEHHAAGFASLPPGALDSVQAAAGGPPDGSHYDYIVG